MQDIQLLITEVVLGILFLGLSSVGWFPKREANKQSAHRREMYDRLRVLEKQLAVNCTVTNESAKRLERLDDRLRS